MTNTPENQQEIDRMRTVISKMMSNMDEGTNAEGNPVKTIYLGSYMNLDPCGRYHCAISVNDMSDECETFWSNLDSAAESLGGFIENGEGDPTDIFFTIMLDSCDEDIAEDDI